MSENIINSSKAPEPVGLYPHARRVGNLLFLSGVGPRTRGTKKIPGVELDENGAIISYDIEAQCRSLFQNVRYILEDSGSSWEKIVDVTVFLTNMRDDFQFTIASMPNISKKISRVGQLLRSTNFRRRLRLN
jgi:2-aminomuconate deaminase